MLHDDESRLIHDDESRLIQGVLMITKMMTKSPWEWFQDWVKNNSRVQDKNQEEFKTQEESLESRIKIQGSRSQESRSRFKTQDSRIKRRLNQDKY